MKNGTGKIQRRDFFRIGGTSLAGLASPTFWNGKEVVDFLPRKLEHGSDLNWEEQLRLRRLQPIRSIAEGEPVYSFGDTFVYAVSPDLTGDSKLQEGNHAETRKIRPKKSWEISTNMLGATSPRVPRTFEHDFQPFLGVHLIDGDSSTYWMSRGQNQPDVEHVWVRIDLPKARRVKSVVLIPRADNQGMPEDFAIQVSRDAWHWDTVYENRNYNVPHDTQSRVFSFEPRLVKQVQITARKCTRVTVADQYGHPTWSFSFCFSLAGVEVIDENGGNLALVSRGAGVTVSSTTRGVKDEKLLHEELWPIHYDLGLKWVRVAYWDSALNWHHVEQEKGRLRIDPVADHVITECALNGVNVVLCLAYGNWLYTPEGKRQHPKTIFEVPWEMAPPPNTPEMLEGYKNFVRFMVHHFRDRVRYFEIWNEPDDDYAWGYKPNPKEYSRLVQETVPIIRREAPQAKILLAHVGFRPGKGSTFLKACLQEGVGKLVDVMTVHPYYGTSQGSKDYLDYPLYVRTWRKLCESYGFHGEYMATESGWYAPYPVPAQPFGGGDVTEIVKAKYLAKFWVTNPGLGMPAFWNETWQDNFTYWDGSLLRNTFSADPVCPMQPQPAYYVMRTLSTVLEGARPTTMHVEFHGQKVKLELYTFEFPDESRLVAFWLPGAGSDVSPDLSVDIRILNATFKKATGIDVLNGTKQELRSSKGSSDALLKGMLIKDYPVLIKFE